MNSTTMTEYFTLIKQCAEHQLDLNGWQWNQYDSLILDWCLFNMEVGHE